MGIKVILENVRCTYVFINEPAPAMDGKEEKKYSLCVLIPKNSKLSKKIRRIERDVVQERWGETTGTSRLKLPLRDGEEREGDEYENMLFFNASSPRKPGIVNRENEPADIDDIEEYGYSGAYFHISVTFYAFSGDMQKGVAAHLNNVMLRKKGKRLDGAVDPQTEFSNYADEDEDEDDDDWD